MTRRHNTPWRKPSSVKLLMLTALTVIQALYDLPFAHAVGVVNNGHKVNNLATYESTGGTRVCPPGHKCVSGTKTICPAGTYNDLVGQKSCKACPADASCPVGTIRPKVAVHAYAVPQMNVQLSIVSDGSSNKIIEEVCVPKLGFICTSNVLELCPKGFFCKNDGIPIPCPLDNVSFCPEGSSSPQKVSEGRYVDMDAQEERICERGYYCKDGIRSPCPGGTYGNARELSDSACSGICRAGFYCPLASVSPEEIPCGGPSTYCPEASSAPVLVDAGFYSPLNRSMQIECPIGSYCMNGLVFPCPAGSANPDTIGLSSQNQCTPCQAGYFCYAENITECGGPDRYCPAADATSPLAVPEGYYTDTLTGAARKSTMMSCDYSLSDPYCIVMEYNALYYASFTIIGEPMNRSVARLCEKGHFCILGDRYECPPGSYGSFEGLITMDCSGVCEPGYFCPAASHSSRQFECPTPDWYCPQGSGSPFPVQVGYYVSEDKSSELPCELGHYCVNGEMRPCPPGTYGAKQGLSTSLCSARCPAGYYCPEASVEARAFPCESPAVFCPLGSGAPRPTRNGYYTTEERSWQYVCEVGAYCKDGVKRACPAGTYGDRTGLGSPSCSGACPAGYFCPEGTVEAETWTCADALGLTKDRQTFRADNVIDRSCLVHLLEVYPEQFFEFSVIWSHQELDPTLWNMAYDKRGLYNITNTMQWDAEEYGFRSQSEDEYLTTGWRPGNGSKTLCFWKKFLSEDIYGLDGLSKEEADNDYFLIGTHWSYRDRLYVSSGPNMGGYGHEGIVVAKDDWNFYCLASGGANSSSEAYFANPDDAPRLVWEQDNNGDDRGIVDQSLNVSMLYGGRSSDAVYGGILHWNTHLSSEQILNAYEVTRYFYQVDQRPVRELQCGAYPSSEWEQGYLGRHVGPVPSVHYEKDDEGNYQPVPTVTRLFQQKDFIVPNLPRGLDNSEAMLFCPLGSPQPRISAPGYYTNKDRTVQIQCPAGSYCRQGIKTPCPAGTYGSSQGLDRCFDYCPAGSYCPEGSIEPLECPDSYYAPPGSYTCVFCGENVVATCKTSRSCCETNVTSY